MSVAIGVAPSCAVEYGVLIEIMVNQNITEEARRNTRAEMKANEIKLITAAILSRRASR